MRFVAIVQARLSSARLPGKILLHLGGKPLLGYVLDSLSHARALNETVIATSVKPGDDAVAEYGQERGVCCFRGSLDHVAERVLEAARSARADVLVRINGDSPLLDPELVDQAVEMFVEETVDIVTNVQPRTFPQGQSVEVISTDVLGEGINDMTTEYDREHVMPFFYAHPERFAISSLTTSEPRSEVHLSVDTAAGLVRCEGILRMLEIPPWEAGWRKCLKAYDILEAGELGSGAR